VGNPANLYIWFKYNDNQDGYTPQVLDNDLSNLLAGVLYKDCQGAQIDIIYNYISPPFVLPYIYFIFTI
jgi:hypothetical protein